MKIERRMVKGKYLTKIAEYSKKLNNGEKMKCNTSVKKKSTMKTYIYIYIYNTYILYYIIYYIIIYIYIINNIPRKRKIQKNQVLSIVRFKVTG